MMRMGSTTYLCVAKKTLTSLGRKAFEETKVEKSRKKERKIPNPQVMRKSVADTITSNISGSSLQCRGGAGDHISNSLSHHLRNTKACWMIGFNSARVFVVSFKCEFDSTWIYVMSSGATKRQISAPETMIVTSINCLCDTIQFKLQTQCPPIQNRQSSKWDGS